MKFLHHQKSQISKSVRETTTTSYGFVLIETVGKISMVLIYEQKNNCKITGYTTTHQFTEQDNMNLAKEFS